MKQGHLGTVETLMSLTYLHWTAVFFTLPAIYFQRAATGAWILNLLTGVVGILVFSATYLLLRRFPGQSVIGIAQEVLGAPGRILIMLAIVAYFFFILVVLLRGIGDNIINMTLPNTPLSFVLGMSVLVCVLVSYMGLEPLTRSIMVFAPFMIFGFMAIVILSLHNADWSRFYPIPGVPMSTLLLQSLWLGPIVNDGVFLAIIPPYLRRDKSILGLYIWATVTSCLMVSAVMLVMMLQMFYPAVAVQPFPLFQLVRLIHIGRFIQRIESIYIVMMVIATSIHTCLLFQGTLIALGQGLRLKDPRPLILPLGIIAFCLCFLFETARQLATMFYSAPHAMFSLGSKAALPLGLFLIAVVRKKRGNTNAQKT